MFCPKCNKDLADNAISCPNCGYNFDVEKSKKAYGCTTAFIVTLMVLIGLFINWLIS